MGRKLSRSITPAEEEEMKSMLTQDPELWYSYELIQAVNSMDDVTNDFVNEIQLLLDTSPDPSRLNAVLLNKLQEPARAKPSAYRMFFRSAAIVIGLIALGWAGIAILKPSVDKQMAKAMNEIIAPRGSKTQITLADGTTIWLNAGSKLTYPKNFSLENREVFLSGEAYFEVVHDDKHAFVVHTHEADIRDLGTTFNVKAYQNTLTTETTLIEGSIEVSLKSDPSRKILMSPNEKLVVRHRSATGKDTVPSGQPPKISRIVPFSKTNDIVETAWVNNKLIFRNERFEDLVAMMERRYDVSIQITDEKIRAYELTGIFRNENVEEALRLLQVIAPFKFEINNEEIIISRQN